MSLCKVKNFFCTYPCWAYALQRIGADALCNFAWIEDVMPTLLQPFSGDALKIGNLLIWDYCNEFAGYQPITIFSDGTVVWDRILKKHHVGVLEGSDLVSDYGFVSDGTLPLVIRMRRLAELYRPAFVIPFDVIFATPVQG